MAQLNERLKRKFGNGASDVRNTPLHRGGAATLGRCLDLSLSNLTNSKDEGTIQADDI